LLSKTDWNSYKLIMAARVKNFLEEKFMPGLKNAIVAEKMFKHEERTWAHGEAFPKNRFACSPRRISPCKG
jgi:hypothetical protein